MLFVKMRDPQALQVLVNIIRLLKFLTDLCHYKLEYIVAIDINKHSLIEVGD